MLNVAITFDYELFFGYNYYDSQSVLFTPTELIINYLSDNGIPSTFFADTCSVTAHERYGLHDYNQSFVKQIQYIVKLGGDVQLHIHPHWLTSIWDGNKWSFDSSHYKIHDFGFEYDNPNNAHRIISDQKNFLQQVIREVVPNYNCVAFRAGGYCLQPSSRIVDCLLSEGFLIDSSVASFLKTEEKSISKDYRNMPNELNWFIARNSEWNIPHDSGLFEVPVGSVNNRILKRLVSPASIVFPRDEKKGEYLAVNNTERKSRLLNIMRYAFGRSLLSLDSMAADEIWASLLSLERKFPNGFIAIVSHPKLYGPNYFENLNKFVSTYSTEIKEKIRFVSMQEIAKIICCK